jgi:hypothetical protein
MTQLEFIRAQVRGGLALAIFVLLGASLCRAQGTFTAASSNESDVNAVINGPAHTAVNGDIIQIPCSGTQSVTWTSSLTVRANIEIMALGGAPNSGAGTFGAGTNCLTILDNAGSSNPLFVFMLTYSSANNVGAVQNINIDPMTGSTSLISPLSFAGTCTSSGCPQIRVSNIYFGKSVPWTSGGNGSASTWLIRSDNVFGVIDHNTVPAGSDVVFDDSELSAYLGVGAYGDNSWAQPDTFSGADNLFVENNSVYVTRSLSDCEVNPIGGAIGGCRSVGRFNQITSSNGFGVFGLHGLDTDGRPRGGRQLTVYGNSITCILNSCNIIAGYRGGTGFTFGNTVTETGSGFFNSFISIAVYRTVYSSASWGYCGGLNSLDPWDSNDNTVYYSGTMTASGGLTMTDGSKSFPNLAPTGAPYSVYDLTQHFVSEIDSNTSTSITVNGPIPESGWTGFNSGDSYQIIRATVCVDQGGRGQGNYVSGATPSLSSAALNQALDPIYEWDNSESPVRLNWNVGTDTGKTIANRDWYTDNSKGTPQAQTSPTSPFNGTSGVGFGTLANRPGCVSPACTVGVGYFATDQGNWNQSENGFGQGEFFTWSGSSWTLHFTPYTYPHPLTTGGSLGTGPTLNPPTDLTATVQ